MNTNFKSHRFDPTRNQSLQLQGTRLTNQPSEQASAVQLYFALELFCSHNSCLQDRNEYMCD